MEVYISINGVLRNLIAKFEYHYENNLIDAEVTVEEGTRPFEYKVFRPLRNDNLLDHFTFQSEEEFKNFLYVEYPLEIFGHAGISYMSAMSDLNKIIYDNPDIHFTLVGIDELGKAKSSTLFFLSKHNFMGFDIKFIRSKDLAKEWSKCDLWVTDSLEIISKCPNNKKAVKFNTDYNYHFTHKNEIKKLDELCLKSWVSTTTSMLTRLLTNVGQFITRKPQPTNQQMIVAKQTETIPTQQEETTEYNIN